jgi:mono/diheme cytochrome c family protein
MQYQLFMGEHLTLLFPVWSYDTLCPERRARLRRGRKERSLGSYRRDGATMKKVWLTLVVLLVAAALVSACGGSGSASSQGGTSAGQTGGTGASGTPGASAGAGSSAAAGDPKAGETLFASATIGSNPGCKTCHTVDGSKLVGPSLQGIATRAGSTVQGELAEQYIRTSITDPNAHVVEGFTAGIMPSFKTVLSDTQLNDLVAYLLTLK